MGTVSFYRIAGRRTWHFGRMQLSNPMATAEPVRSILRAGFDSQNWALVRSDCLTRPPGVGVGDRSDYISSRMRFVLFDSVVAKECHIRRYWAQRGAPAFRYFAFQLLLALAVFGGLAFFGSIAAIIAFGTGWLRNPRQYLVPLILMGIVIFFFVAAFLVVVFLVAVLTKDFVVPQMALEDLPVAEGWRRLWSRLMTEKGGYAGYVGMK